MKEKNNKTTKFQWAIWTIFALENWILDFGRPIAMVFIDIFNESILHSINLILSWFSH